MFFTGVSIGNVCVWCLELECIQNLANYHKKASCSLKKCGDFSRRQAEACD